MKIESTRILAAGNIFGSPPVARLAFSRKAANHGYVPASFGSLIETVLPPQPIEVLDFPTWKLLQSAHGPVQATLIVEALALLIQRSVGWLVSFSASANVARPNDSMAVFEVTDVDAGLHAGELGVTLFNCLLEKNSEGHVDSLREIFRVELNIYDRKNYENTPNVETFEIVKRAQRRDIPWSVLPNSKYVRLGQGRYSKFLLQSESSHTSALGVRLSKKKQVASSMLAAACLPVAMQRTARSLDAALASANWIGFPVVIKPAEGNMGKGISVGVANAAQVPHAFEKAQSISKNVIIESFIPGDEYRLLVIDGKFRAAAMRRPAHVRGDGLSTVRQLVDLKNQDPNRQPGQSTHLYPLLLDHEATSCLVEQGLSLDAIPEANQVVFLRRVSNVSQGGDTVDVTDSVHLSVQEIAERAASILDIDVCGVDFITTDITCPQGDVAGAICEVNTRPGLSVHTLVSEGTSRDVADPLVQMLFPDGAPCRIPIIALLRGGGEDAILDAILARAGKAGHRVGLVAPEGTISRFQGRRLRSYHHLDQIEEIKTNRMLDAVVVVVSAYDIINFGLGFDRIDLAILSENDHAASGQPARDLLARLAGGRTVAEDDPAVIDRALEALNLPRGSRRGTEIGPSKLSRKSTVAAAAIGTNGLLRDGDNAEFTVLLLGNIGFGEPYFDHPRASELRRLFATRGHRHSFLRVRDLLSAANLKIGNLGAPLARTPDPGLQRQKKYLGWSDADETVQALLDAGIDALSLANNHALDCGELALRETIQRLRDSGIESFGAGANLEAAGRPFIKTVRIGPTERTIVVFGCFESREKYERQFNWYAGAEKAGVDPILPERIAEEIAALRETVPAPFFIVFPHWGADYLGVQQNQRDYAEQLMSAGADLIVGHGAQVLQGVEKVAGRLVVYGLGNFVWNTPGRYKTTGAIPYSLAAAVCFRRMNGKESVFLRLYPLMTDNTVTKFQTRAVSSAEFPDALAALTSSLNLESSSAVVAMDKQGPYLEIPIQEYTQARSLLSSHHTTIGEPVFEAAAAQRAPVGQSLAESSRSRSA